MNSDVHHVIDGLSSPQQQELTVRIHELLQTKKNSLLKRHKHLRMWTSSNWEVDLQLYDKSRLQMWRWQLVSPRLHVAIFVHRITSDCCTCPRASPPPICGIRRFLTTHPLNIGKNYCKTTRNHDTMSPSLLCSFIQVSLLQLTDPSISSPMFSA